MALVDVVIPTYNALPYLRWSINSVLQQTHSDLAIFIVDDGSDDDTEAYVTGLKDSRVAYTRKQNGGQASARNLGIKISQSPYVAFLDADDVWHETKIERQLSLMTEDTGLVYCHQETLNEAGTATGSLEATLRGRVFDHLLDGNHIVGSASAVLLPRTIIESVGGFNEELRSLEDWEYWLRVTKAHPVDFVPEPLVGIRVRSDALQRNYRRLAIDNFKALDSILSEFDLDRGQRRKVVEACLHRAVTYGLLAGDKGHALKAVRRLVKESPGVAFAPRNWARYKGFFSRPPGKG